MTKIFDDADSSSRGRTKRHWGIFWNNLASMMLSTVGCSFVLPWLFLSRYRSYPILAHSPNYAARGDKDVAKMHDDFYGHQLNTIINNLT